MFVVGGLSAHAPRKRGNFAAGHVLRAAPEMTVRLDRRLARRLLKQLFNRGTEGYCLPLLRVRASGGALLPPRRSCCCSPLAEGELCTCPGKIYCGVSGAERGIGA